MMKDYKPGDQVTSISVKNAGIGLIYRVHMDTVDVLWSDGTRSRERIQDLIWFKHTSDWDPIARKYLPEEAETKLFGTEEVSLCSSCHGFYDIGRPIPSVIGPELFTLSHSQHYQLAAALKRREEEAHMTKMLLSGGFA